MEDIEEGDNNEHQCGVKDVNVYLGALECSGRATDVLGDSKDGSNHDEHAGHVHYQDKFLPWCGNRKAGCSGIVEDSTVEDHGHNHEKSEKDDLNAETADDDILAQFLTARGFGVG